jgi:riboflavin biosynthesis pyrimidine reductase
MKPHVICHMMSPLDGRLIVDDWKASTGHTIEELVEVYDAVHDKIGADAWLSGRSTGKEFADGIDKPYDDVGVAERPIHLGDPEAESFAILIDKDGRLRWDKNQVSDDHVIVVLGAGVPDSHLVGLEKRGVSYIVCDNDGIDLTFALDTLASTFGIKRVMLEGGARTNGEFLKAGLVDQISFILFPAIGGKSGSPAIFEGGQDGLADKVKLKMTSFEPAGLATLHVMYDLE